MSEYLITDFGHISKTSINMADGGKFGGKRRRELK
jgi:hypothetical protein